MVPRLWHDTLRLRAGDGPIENFNQVLLLAVGPSECKRGGSRGPPRFFAVNRCAATARDAEMLDFPAHVPKMRLRRLTRR